MRRSTLLRPELGDALSRELVPACIHAYKNLNPRGPVQIARKREREREREREKERERGTLCTRSRSL